MRRSWVVAVVVVLALSMGTSAPLAQTAVSETFTSRFKVTGRDDKNYLVTITVVSEPESSRLLVELRRRVCKKKESCWSRRYVQLVGDDELTVDHADASAELQTRFGGAELAVSWRWEWDEYFEVEPSPSVGAQAEHDAVTLALPALNFACAGTGTYRITASSSSSTEKGRVAPDRLPWPFRKVGTWAPSCSFRPPP